MGVPWTGTPTGVRDVLGNGRTCHLVDPYRVRRWCVGGGLWVRVSPTSRWGMPRRFGSPSSGSLLSDHQSPFGRRLTDP